MPIQQTLSQEISWKFSISYFSDMIYKRKPYLSVLNDWLHVEVWYIDIIWSLNLEGKGAGGPITTISLGIKLKIDDCVLGWRGGGDGNEPCNLSVSGSCEIAKEV